MSDEPLPEKKEKTKREGIADTSPSIEPPPKDLQNAIKKLSEAQPQTIIEMMAFAGGMGNPLHNKMESQHITQVLDLAIKHDEREFEIVKTKESYNATDKASARRYVFGAFLVIVGLVLVVLFLFKDQPQVLVPLLTGIGGLASGFLAGLGVGKAQTK